MSIRAIAAHVVRIAGEPAAGKEEAELERRRN
jgi:hypothetical protein